MMIVRKRMLRRRLPSGWPRRLVLSSAGVMALTAALMAVTLVGCESGPDRVPRGTLRQKFPDEPTVRIRVATAQQAVRVETAGALVIGAPYGDDHLMHGREFAAPATISHRDGAFVIQPARGQAVSWALATLRIESASGQPLRIAGGSYPSALVLHPMTANAAGRQTPIEVINHVPIESYLPGVLHKEMYQSWHPEAFRAQAIVARSYALAQLERTRRRHYDLESTQASQAYAGAGAHDKATSGVRATRGAVLSYEGKILPAYYSSCVGGIGQDASEVFPNQPDLPPLRGREVGGWGSSSPYYRWGPIARPRADLAARMAAWGRNRTHPIRLLRSIGDIRVVARNAVGRPTGFAVIDSGGQAYSLGAEEFRFACNFTGDGLPPVADKALLRSSFVTVTVAGNEVRFTEGRGYGHGVGLCQYGAQEMALRGYAAEAIVAFYYPGAAQATAY